MTNVPVLSDAQKLLARIQADPLIQKNFRLKVEQGLNYLSGDPAALTTDLQLVSFEQTNPQPIPALPESDPEGTPKPEAAGPSVFPHIHELAGQPQWLWKALPTQNHSTIFTCGGDKMIYKWALVSHTYHMETFGFHDGQVFDIILSQDESLLFSAGKDKIIKMWNVADGSLVQQYMLEFEIFRIILDKNEKRVIAGGINGEIQIVDLETNMCDKLPGHSAVIRDLWLAQDGTTLYSCSQDKLISIWNIDTLECTGTHEGHTKEVFALVPTADEKLLYSSGNDDKINIWSLPDMTKQGEIQLEDASGSLALSASGTLVFVGLQNGAIQVFDARTRQQVSKLTGATDRITSVWVSANEALVIAASKDKTVKFWERHEIREGIRNFNLNTKRGNLFSVDLSDEAVLLEPVFFKPLNERPNGYTVNLTDELDNRVMTMKLKPISYKPKDETVEPEETLQVRLETVTEFQVSVGDVLENPELFKDFKLTHRFDNREFGTFLTLTKSVRKDGVTLDQIQDAVGGFRKDVQNKPDLIRNFDLDGDIAEQVTSLLGNFDEDYIDHDEDYRTKIEALGQRLKELEEKSAKLTELNDSLRSFFENSESSIENLNTEIGKVLDDDEMRQNLTDFFFRIKAKNPFVDSVLIKGSLTHGVLNGFCTRVDSNDLTIKGEFRNGLLNGRGMKITKPNILSGSFKDGILEKKPYVIYERNGIIRVADDNGEINKLIFRGITYQAKGISEIYEGPAFVSFPDKTCFTSIVKNLRLVPDIINKHLVFFYGPEQRSHFLVYDEETKMLREDGRNVFQINWEHAQIVKL